MDVSILDIGDGTFEVLATSGDTHLGGDDWDNAVMDWLRSEIQNQCGITISRDNVKDRPTLQRLRDEAEKAKINLSSQRDTIISLPYIGFKDGAPVNFETTLTRAKFQDLTRNLLDRCQVPFEKALADAKLSVTDLDDIILVGGSTRRPAVVDRITRQP